MNYWYNNRIYIQGSCIIDYGEEKKLESLIEKHSDQLSFLIFNKKNSFRHKIAYKSYHSSNFKWFFNFINDFTYPYINDEFSESNIPLDVLKYIISFYPRNIMEELTEKKSKLSYNTILLNSSVLRELHQYYCYNYERLNKENFNIQLSNIESNNQQNKRIQSLIYEIYDEQKLLK